MNNNFQPDTTPSYYAPSEPKNAAYYRRCARNVLQGNWVNLSLAQFVSNFILEAAMGLSVLPGFVMAIVGALMAEGGDYTLSFLPFIGLLLMYVLLFAVAIVLGGPFTVGIARVHLNAVDKKPFSLGTIFSAFKQGLGRAIGLYSLYMLVVVGVAVLGALLMLGAICVLTVLLVAIFEVASPFILIPFVLVFYFGVVALVAAFSYRYAMIFYIAADHPEMRAVEVLRASVTLMKGNKWRLFCLQFSFIGWSLLAAVAGMITCGLGMLAIYPLAAYTATANAIFYDDISGRETAQEECSDTSAFLVNELPPEESAE